MKNELPILIINDNGSYQRDKEKKRYFSLHDLDKSLSEFVHRSERYSLEIKRQDETKRNVSFIFTNEEEGLAPMIIPVELREDEYIELEQVELTDDMYNIFVKSYGQYVIYEEEDFPMLDVDIENTPRYVNLKISLVLNRMGEKIGIMNRPMTSLCEATNQVNIIDYALKRMYEEDFEIFDEQKALNNKYIIDTNSDPDTYFMIVRLHGNHIVCINTDNGQFYNIPVEKYILNTGDYLIVEKDEAEALCGKEEMDDDK